MAVLINDTSSIAIYTASAGQTAFAVPFEFFAVTDLVVERNGVALAYNASPANNSQYSVTGANVEGGGAIALGGPGAVLGDRIVVYRNLPLNRRANYPETGPFDVRALNFEMARYMAIMQQLRDRDGTSSADVEFYQAGTGAVERTVQSKLRDTVSVKDFGAVGDGTTDDTAAITAADAASGKKYVPAGTYDTTLASVSLDGPYWGEGQIRDVANNKRAPWFSAVKAPPASFGNQDSVETISNGDLSKTQIFMEHRITGATTLGQPPSGYLNRPECYPFVGALYVGPDAGFQASPSTDLSRTNATFQFVNVYHYGRGDGIALTANIFVAGNNSATDALAFPAGLCLAGQVTAGANDVNLNPIEVNAIDGGFNASMQSIIGNVFRENNSTAKGRYVYGARMQSQGTHHGDSAFSAQGKWKVGLDLTPLETDTNFGAIAIKQSDRIYLNAQSTTGRYVTSYGGDWIERNAFGVLNFVVANNSRLQIGDTINCQVPTRLPVYTVATLPVAAVGMECFVSDANSTTRGAVVAGGGSNFVKIYRNNASQWIIA